jgi:hypothetical protein
MKKSYEALKPHAWAMVGLLFVLGLINMVGYCACGVGMLVSLPICAVTLGLHYNYFFPPSVPEFEPMYASPPDPAMR